MWLEHMRAREPGAAARAAHGRVSTRKDAAVSPAKLLSGLAMDAAGLIDACN